MKIEDLKLGYPRLTALLTAEPNFFVARRFTRLHTRRVLFAQDRLTELEARLDQIDADDRHRIHLASRRHDANQERAAVMRDVEVALRDYECAIVSYRAVAALPYPNNFDVASLENWIYNNKPLIQEESEFTRHRNDLFAVAPRPALGPFDSWVHRLLRFRSLGRPAETAQDLESQDINVHLRSSRRVGRVVGAVGTIAVVLVITIPIAITYLVHNQAARLCVVLFSVVAATLSLKLLTLARRVEVFVGTAT
ncbi:hypothetical protein B0H67DRAFT_642670 [Lasiosphaeris hirsuta]|uniref:DUF6594 domain-containing protein n=1 Tax=Lasiosphaeris hirsuta TaxID=260670 RepID=A0AA40ANW5_9PEZI|nr:hypothetical protein B0H67DRAFT_642670 [Lasiosphaeris hirsuta]